MLRRLMLLHLAIAAIIMGALAVWLAVSIAERHTKVAVLERIDEAQRLAASVSPELRSRRDDDLGRDLAAYDARTGTPAVVIAADGSVVAASRPGLVPLPPVEGAQVDAALAGTRGVPHGPIWPWQRHQWVVVEPIADPAGGWSGALLIWSSTEAVRGAVMEEWSILAAVLVLALLTVGAVTMRSAQWIASPVRQLTAMVRAMDRGGPRTAAAGGGPPELRELAAALDDVSRRSRAQLARQSAFVSYASHQLRAPLAALRLRAEALGMDLPDVALSEHALLVEEIDRLAGICDAMLAFARDQPIEAATDVDVATVLDMRIGAWVSVATLSGVTLRRDGDYHGWAPAPEEIVDQIIDVLLDNAIRHAGPGATVTATLRSTGDYVDVHIVDDGPGMTAAELARAAMPFWSGNQRTANRGAGLGLAIASALAGSIGMRLHLSRVEPHGVDAWLRLPAAAPASTVVLTTSPGTEQSGGRHRSPDRAALRS